MSDAFKFTMLGFLWLAGVIFVVGFDGPAILDFIFGFIWAAVIVVLGAAWVKDI